MVNEAKIKRLLFQIQDARIDLAVKLYTEALMNIDNLDEHELEQELADIKRKSAWPEFETRKTIADVTTAKGNFTW
jgi:hypothetical protein